MHDAFKREYVGGNGLQPEIKCHNGGTRPRNGEDSNNIAALR